MKLVDANVLLYATNRDTHHHESARSWLDKALVGREPIGIPLVCLLAFVRLATRARVFPNPLTPAQAMDVVETWMAQPAALTVEPTPRHFSILRGLLEEAGTAGNLTTDAHIAALATEYGAEIVSFDTDFVRFPGVRLIKPA